MTTTERVRLDQVSTVMFDVMGTVVDDLGSISADSVATLGGIGLTPDQAVAITEQIGRRHAQLMADVVEEHEPWQSHRGLRVIAVDEALSTAGISAPTEAVLRLQTVIHRLHGWPDSSAALARLRGQYLVAALSNADLSELAALSAHADLAWHATLSGEFARSFKPNPAVYEMAKRRLDVDPARILMVAAHPWDLRAAAEHGMKTAYIARSAEAAPETSDHFDLMAADLADLADQLLAD